MGLETEHGFSAHGFDMNHRGSVLDRLVSIARQRIVHLPDCGSGMFLANGSRFYIDTGGHPEFCTPEVDNPWDLVRYICAGDLILHRLAEQTATVGRGQEVFFFKCHVDYRNRSTWGCHENFGHKASKEALPAQLIPHLATRIFLGGAGGLDPLGQGVEFVLSPRTCHLEGATCHSSTDHRGIYHYKDEPLSSHGWSRLHLLCGESVMSHRAMLLKAGTTALVVAMIEGGLAPGDKVRLKTPIESMRAFNVDPAGRVTAPLEGGREMTALQIQRHYLEFAEAHLGHNCLPGWAPALCRCWRETLDLLDRGPGAVDRMLDWAIKHSLYHERIRRRGLTPEQLAFWNEVLRKFDIQWDDGGSGMQPLTPRRILGAGDILRNFEPRLQELGLSWDRVENVLQLRAELCELEVRFSRLGPMGVFNALDQAGHLRHALPEVTRESIEAATKTPPARGRAGVRGRLIQQLHGQGRCTADWSGVSDLAGRLINLSDPFINEAPGWEPSPQETLSDLDPARQLLAEVDRRYNRGEYEAAWNDLQALRQLRHRLQRAANDRALQLTAWVQSRRGYTSDALQALHELSGRRPVDLERISDTISALRFNGLAPQPGPMLHWIRQAEELLARPGAHSVSARFAFLGHKAALLVQARRLDDAHHTLTEALALAQSHNSQSRVLARSLCDLAEVHRLRNDPSSARDCLDRAQHIQTANNYDGDFAEFNLPRRAKLATDRAGAKGCLNQARLIQRRLQHRVGMTKTVLLQTRLLPSLWHNQRRKRILLAWQRAVPMLRDCPLMLRIMSNWDQWAGGGSEAGEDFFWGL